MTTHKKNFLLVLSTLIIVLALVVTPAFAEKSPPKTDIEKEIELGKEAAKDLEKDCKLITDEALLSRVRTIGGKVSKIALSEEVPASYGEAAVANFEYTFKIIDDKKVNAFCLPGGLIYVNQGLLDFVQSDHELAAVLAHEVAHAAHHHIKILTREQSKLHRRFALILLAGLIGRIPQRDLGNVMLGTQFYKTARLNGYGQLAEKDADMTAIHYLNKTGYNPVGMLTFLERLNKTSDLVELGIMQTHPRTDDRISDVTAALHEQNIPIQRRHVTNAATARVLDVEVEGKTVHELAIGDKVKVKLAGDKDRAVQVAESLNHMLDNGVTMKDIDFQKEKGTVVANKQILLEVTNEDASLNNSSRADTAEKITEGIRRVIWQEMVDMIR